MGEKNPHPSTTSTFATGSFDLEGTGIILDEGRGMKDGGEEPSSLYDLQGRKVANNLSSLSGNSWYSSPKGIYIVNGKKIIKK